MKYLLILFFVVLVWGIWRQRNRRVDAPPSAKAEEPMVVCAQCGVYLPQSESLMTGPQFYCCEDHRQAGSAGQ